MPRKFEAEMSWEERLAEFRARLRAVVRKRLMADVPLGSFLRGGLDSSLITALIREDRTKMHTFSVATEDGADRLCPVCCRTSGNHPS
jgi:asparagine synthase (glutamine-hydrolysing)